MSHHGHEKPEKTFTLAYVPVTIIGIVLVAWVFGSGYMRGVNFGQPHVEGEKKPAKKAVNVRALADQGKELAGRGKTLFETNCVSCHGAQGFGDGDKGLNLNPRPRNFHSADAWKHSRSVVGIYNTLKTGVPGSSMASYMLLPEEDRMAMAHYVSHWVPEQPAPTAEELASLPVGDAGGGAEAAGAAVASGPSIPIELAMKKLTQPSVYQVSRHASAANAMPGAALFAAQCAACHGPSGQGQRSTKLLTTAPYVRLQTEPMVASASAWRGDESKFRTILTSPVPGGTSHSFATMTNSEVQDLYEYCKALAK